MLDRLPGSQAFLDPAVGVLGLARAPDLKIQAWGTLAT